MGTDRETHLADIAAKVISGGRNGGPVKFIVPALDPGIHERDATAQVGRWSGPLPVVMAMLF